ncbi:MAG: radical SAM protein [Deltaproteobacteria bacterium]|nr:radical SAM protein [Deltaproteobacteria bacterium]
MRERLKSIPALGLRQLRWMLGDRSPFIATLKLTYRCNLTCVHCAWSREKSREITTTEWKDRIDDLRRRGVVHFVFEGGEPTLRDDLGELVDHAREVGGKVTLSTNGTRDLTGYNPNRFLISLDGLEKTHDSIRGDGAFTKMSANLPRVEHRKDALVTVSRLNYHEIPALMDPVMELFDGFWFSFIYDYDGSDPIGLTSEQMKRAGRKLLDLADRYPIINIPFSLSRVGTKRPCLHWLLTTVTPDGNEVGDCMIKALETYECDRCELSCHREVSDIVNPRLYTFFLKRYLTVR